MSSPSDITQTDLDLYGQDQPVKTNVINDWIIFRQSENIYFLIGYNCQGSLVKTSQITFCDIDNQTVMTLNSVYSLGAINPDFSDLKQIVVSMIGDNVACRADSIIYHLGGI